MSLKLVGGHIFDSQLTYSKNSTLNSP